MRKTTAILTMAMFGVAFLAAAWPGAAEAQALRMRIQTSVPSAATQFEALQQFAERLNKMSGGRLRVEALPIGAVVGLGEILEGVDKGVVEAGYAWTHVWSGKHPAAGLWPLSGAVAGMDQTVQLAWMMSGEGRNLLRELYADHLKTKVVVFSIMGIGPEALGWFKEPIKNMADFRKLRFRTPPGLPGEIYKELGIAAVSLPGPDILPAAQRGVIDAGEWGYPADDLPFGFHRVWKHYYLQGLHQVTTTADLTINRDFWNKLSPDLQMMIETAVVATNMEHYALLLHRNGQFLKELVEKHGVVLHDTPKDYFDEFPKATARVLEKYAKQDPFFKKVIDSKRQFAQVVLPYYVTSLRTHLSVAESALKQKK